MKKKIDVNEIRELIAKVYGYSSVQIEAVDIGGVTEQCNAEHKEVGWGGVLTLYLDIKEK